MPSTRIQPDESNQPVARAGVFVDRDGTLIREAHYLHRLEDMEIFPCAAEAIRLLNRSGRLVVVVTNQSGVARGILSEGGVRCIHTALETQLADLGARIDGFYYCPHLPGAPVEEYNRECECRKPNPGMVFAAAKDLNIDLSRSYLVGDKQTDVDTARRAACGSILVRTGYGTGVAERLVKEPETGTSGDSRTAPSAMPDYIAEDLLDAARWIVSRRRVARS